MNDEIEFPRLNDFKRIHVGLFETRGEAKNKINKFKKKSKIITHRLEFFYYIIIILCRKQDKLFSRTSLFMSLFN